MLGNHYEPREKEGRSVSYGARFTVKRDVPDTKWPSALRTRQFTVKAPLRSGRAAVKTTRSPFRRVAPLTIALSKPRTTMRGLLTSSLNVRVIVRTAAAIVEPFAGLIDSSSECAEAGVTPSTTERINATTHPHNV
jgi:hypothetical protein